MWQKHPCAIGGLALVLLSTSTASAAGPGTLRPPRDAGTIVQPAHSVYAAERTLYRRGYYDVQLERASLPYSFTACKRDVRYHIHVDYYGDLVQVDPIGRCGAGYRDRYGDEDDYRGRRYYRRYPYRY